jgi:hypothetical protein
MTVQLATGRYATFDPSMGVPVGITVGKPKFPLRYRIAAVIPELAPHGDLFAINDRDEFTRRYRARLDQVGIQALMARFEQIASSAEDDRLVLLCFEDLTRPGEWCHRRIAAEWLEEHAGIDVPEVVPATLEAQLALDTEAGR